ncbi:GntR family transcriptional regulator [Novimethylophilus kurashikiensis]|uniref:GntR family transcriptional regulator n=1 Tax=Novimethylophilus kurashikiensis TaxID=1825523 RepID=A0A2R5FBS5_9PROT|nr:PLP-dependent aminotransferase family protein [Novimethylophilus kurashikiensis]GBG15475.1 GntR family transcriptional regulator [Novimethylophilus kurashikiensis]
MKRYEQLADDIARSIQEGMLRPGDRLPSVRQTSTSRGVSPSTVFEAYYLLEARGVITARPRSGYFVALGSQRLQALPAPTSTTHSQPQELDVSELVFEVLEATRARKSIPFGSAFPSPLLFPMARLARHIASTVQQMDPWRTVEDLGPGDQELRRHIALRYRIDGIQVPVDEIVITNGAMEALNLCLAAVTRPGDTVLIESPTFYAALQCIERSGLKAVEVPSHPVTGIDLDCFEEAIEKHRPQACWLMTNFQNPQGSLMPVAHKQRLVQLVTRHQIPLIEDDVYGELYFGEKRPPPAKAFDTEGWVMHCASFSKCLAPGYRVGWTAPGRFAKQLERLKLTTSLATSVPAQQALASYLGKGGYDRHLRQLRHTLMLQQMQYLEAIQRYFPEGTRITRPEGGYFFWIKLPDDTDALALHRSALENGISVAPGPIFSAHRGFKNYLRLNYGHPYTQEVEAAIKKLALMVG